MSTTVTFSDLSIGDLVTNQFTDDYGITFTSPAAKVSSDPKSPLPNVLVAARAGGGVEFPTWSIRGTLTSGTHSRFGVTVNTPVTIDFRDKNGNHVGTYYVQPPKFQTDGSYFYGEFATGKADISSFDIHFVSDHPFLLSSINFDTSSVRHQPDFRLLLSGSSIPVQNGKSGFISVIVARLYGSKNMINLSASTSPSGLFVSSAVAFNGADGAEVKIPLTATTTRIQADNVITVSGVPSSALAGTSKREVHYAYSPPLQLPPP